METKFICLLKIIFYFLFYFQKASASLLKNGVQGEPRVECGVESINVKIRTENEFYGRLYVEEESEHPDCVQSYAPGNGLHLKSLGPRLAQFSIRFGQCNMRRQRILNPRGVSYSFTLVVSFHPIFLTGVDKAFHIKCFFLEAVKAVDIALDVNPLTTIMVEREFALPRCTYHLKQEPNGPYLKFANIGEPITHSWECDPVAGLVYGVLIHSCYVDDGRGNRFDLVDERGCAVDRYLLDDIVYDEKGLGAFVNSHVFRYADRIQLFFTCTLQLCFKEDGGCNGITPPNCLSKSESYTHPEIIHNNDNHAHTHSNTQPRQQNKRKEQPPHNLLKNFSPRRFSIPPGISAPQKLLRSFGNRALPQIFNKFSSDRRASPVGTTVKPPETSESLLLNSYKDSPLKNETEVTLNGMIRASRETTVGNMETDLSADLTVLPFHDLRANIESETMIKKKQTTNHSKFDNNNEIHKKITQTTTSNETTKPTTIHKETTKPTTTFYEKDFLVESETKHNLPLTVATFLECSTQQNLIILTIVFIVTLVFTSVITSIICVKKQERKLWAFCCCLKFWKSSHSRNNFRY